LKRRRVIGVAAINKEPELATQPVETTFRPSVRTNPQPVAAVDAHADRCLPLLSDEGSFSLSKSVLRVNKSPFASSEESPTPSVASQIRPDPSFAKPFTVMPGNGWKGGLLK